MLEILEKILDRILGMGGFFKLRLGTKRQDRAQTVVVSHPIFRLPTAESSDPKDFLQRKCLIIETQRQRQFMIRMKLFDGLFKISKVGIDLTQDVPGSQYRFLDIS